MAGLDERYIPITLLNQFFINKDTGLPLSNGTLSFFRDTSRTTPKPVFQLSSSGGEYEYVALPNPVSLNSVGTVQNAGGDNVAIYAYPYIQDPVTGRLELDLYYIEAHDEFGVLQWTREAVPSLSEANDPINETANDVSNQLANPQFSRYFLSDSAVNLTVSGSLTTFPIAPDWDIVATGTGTIIVERFLVAGNEAIPTSPAAYLRITTNLGVTSATLRQRFNFNSGVWSGKFISGFICARLESGSDALSMQYQDSSGVNSNVTIFSASLVNDWATFGGSVQLNDSSNTQSGSDAFVDIAIELPTGSIVDVTSTQVIVSDAAFLDVQGYTERTANREQALMGDYYIPNLEYKPIPSLLIGWDFPLNPRQFGTSGTVAGGTAEYIWDQTILQTFPGLSVDYGANTKTNGLSLNHQDADLPFAIIQYLDQEDAAKMVGSPLSMNVNGYTVNGGNNAGETAIQVKLFANKDPDQFPTLPDTIIELDLQGNISLTASAIGNGWYEIERSNLPAASNSLSPLSPVTDLPFLKDIQFNQWVIEDETQINDGVQGFAVAMSFLPAASSTDYETQLDSISLNLGNIPTRPAPLSTNETREKCQKFYEMTYDTGEEVGDVGKLNYRGYPAQPFSPVGGGSVARSVYAGAIYLKYFTKKRAAPLIKFYNVQIGPAFANEDTVEVDYISGSSDFGATSVVFSNHWAPDGATTGRESTQYGRISAPLSGTPIFNVGVATDIGGTANLAFHNTIDARIGADLTP